MGLEKIAVGLYEILSFLDVFVQFLFLQTGINVLVRLEQDTPVPVTRGTSPPLLNVVSCTIPARQGRSLPCGLGGAGKT